MELTEEQRERVRAIRAAQGLGFAAQIAAAGLDPKSDFRHANLRGVDFAGADLRGFDFTGADLSGADLSKARLEGARFKDALLGGARFPGGSVVAPLPRTGVPVLRDYQLRAAVALLQAAGDAWAVMPSGAGKTTVLERVAGELLVRGEVARGAFVTPHRSLRVKFKNAIEDGLPGLTGDRTAPPGDFMVVTSPVQLSWNSREKYYSHLFLSDVVGDYDIRNIKRTYPEANIFGVLSSPPEGLSAYVAAPGKLRFAMSFEGKAMGGPRPSVEFIAANGEDPALRAKIRLENNSVERAALAFVSRYFEAGMDGEISIAICPPRYHVGVRIHLENWQRENRLGGGFRIGEAIDLRARPAPGLFVMSIQEARGFNLAAVANLIVLSGGLGRGFVESWASWPLPPTERPPHKKLYDFIGLTIDGWAKWDWGTVSDDERDHSR